MPANTHAEKSAAAKGLPPFGGCAASACLSASPKTGGAKKEDKNIDVKRNIP